MTFLHPLLFAAGVAAIAIPILIHLLLRQRRRPVMWGAMRFLIEAYRRQKQRLRLEQWLLLAARCLLVALVGMALARPLLQSAGLLAGPTGRSVYVLLDNGLASGAREGDAAETAALERHKAGARAILSSLGPADRAGLILLGGPAMPIVVPASADIAAVTRLVDEAEATDAPTDLAGAFDRVAQELDRDPGAGESPTTLVVLSDFFAGSADLSRPLPQALSRHARVQLMLARPRDAAGAPTNIQVTAVEPLRAMVLTGGAGAESDGSQREQVRISLRRFGPDVSQPATSTVRLRATQDAAGASAESPPAQGLVRWQPGQTESMLALQVNPISGPADSVLGSVLIAEIDRDALPADNIFRRPIGVREALRVGVVARARFGAEVSLERMAPADWFRFALRPTSGTPIDIIDIEPASLDAPTLASVDALILPAPDLVREEDWARLRRFVDAGGLLIVSPAAEATVHLWTDAMTRELGLAWRLAREPVKFDEPMSLDDQPPSSPLLSLIASELPGLLRPVGVFRAVPPEGLDPASEALLSLKNGSPWIIASEPGGGDSRELAASPASRGLVLYFASAPALAWTDLPAKPLMVPLIQELIRQGVGRAAGAWTARAGAPLAAPPRTALLKPAMLRDAESAPTPLAVGAGGFTAEPVRRAGLWLAQDEAGRPRAYIAVNPDPDAGRTTPQDPSAVRSWIAASLATAPGAGPADDRITWIEPDAAPTIAAAAIESPLSLPLLIGALVIALAELIMARYFSHAFASTPAR